MAKIKRLTNPIAVAMKLRHGKTTSIMKHRGEPRGGNKNEQREFLEENSKMKYGVFDNNNPAILGERPDSLWNQYLYNTLDEAQEYAKGWLGDYYGQKLELNKPIDYSGYGDTLEIREVWE